VLVILDLNVSMVAVALVVGLALIAWIPMPVLAALALLFTWLGERRRERWALAPRCPGPQTQSSRGVSLESELRSCRAGVLRAVVRNVRLGTVVQSRRSCSAQLLGISLGLVVRTRPLWGGRGNAAKRIAWFRRIQPTVRLMRKVARTRWWACVSHGICNAAAFACSGRRRPPH
jgi:hypothetical protein